MLPLTLSLDTGPDFNVESFAFPACRTPSPKVTAVTTPTTMSFGHPGISALEFAGTPKEDSTPATLANRDKSVSDDIAHEGFRQKLMVELDPPQPILLEIGSQQGRRGLFLNHTPREWEMRGSKTGHGHKTSYASSDASHTATWTQHWRKTPPRDWSAEECIAILAANGPGPEIEEEDEEVENGEAQQEDVGKEEDNNEEEVPKLRDSIVTDATYSRPQTATQAFIASSMAAKIATPPALRRSSARSSLDVGSLRSGQYPQNTGKRRRRQTPFKLTAPSNLVEGKHAPLRRLQSRIQRRSHAILGPSPRRSRLLKILRAQMSAFTRRRRRTGLSSITSKASHRHLLCSRSRPKPRRLNDFHPRSPMRPHWRFPQFQAKRPMALVSTMIST